MKRVIFLTAILFSVLSGFSQIYQGQWLAGGNVSFNTGKFGDFENSKYTSFQFNPNAGYFFINNLAGGLRVSLKTTKVEDEDDATTVVAVAPFARYYFLPAEQKVNIFADASYGFGSMKNGESESFNRYTISAGPAVFLSPNTALEFALQYTSEGGDAYGGDDRMNDFGVNIGFQVHLGRAKK